jgi:hypothetical protein
MKLLFAPPPGDGFIIIPTWNIFCRPVHQLHPEPCLPARSSTSPGTLFAGPFINFTRNLVCRPYSLQVTSFLWVLFQKQVKHPAQTKPSFMPPEASMKGCFSTGFPSRGFSITHYDLHLLSSRPGREFVFFIYCINLHNFQYITPISKFNFKTLQLWPKQRSLQQKKQQKKQ